VTYDPASPRRFAPRRRSSWWGAAALLLTSATLAQAGALDRTLQPVGVLFEDGNYAELSYGFTSPEVSGTLPGTDIGSGNVGVDYDTVTLSFKVDVTDRVSVAVVVDQPFGADVDYGTPTRATPSRDPAPSSAHPRSPCSAATRSTRASASMAGRVASPPTPTSS
jgi:hypothetical protein